MLASTYARMVTLAQLVVAGVVVAFAGSAVAAEGEQTAALIPVVAEGLLPSARDALEENVRAAVSALGVRLQSAAATKAHIDEGAAAGLDCRITAEDCALRVGLIADVDVVMLVSVEPVGERTLLRGAWLDVDGGPRRHIAGEVKLAGDGGKSLRAVLRLLVTGDGAPAAVPVPLAVSPATAVVTVNGAVVGADRLPWLLPGRHTLRAQAPGHVPLTRTLEVRRDGTHDTAPIALSPEAGEGPGPQLFTGVGIASAGALLAVGSLGFVAFTEAQLQDGAVAHDDRGDAVTAGLVALGLSAVGVGALGAGALVAAWGASP